MYLEKVKLALGQNYQVTWQEEVEASPIRIKLRSTNKAKLAINLQRWISAITAATNSKAEETEQCTKLPFKTSQGNLHATFYKSGTVMIQGQSFTLGHWINEKFMNIIKEVTQAEGELQKEETETVVKKRQSKTIKKTKMMREDKEKEKIEIPSMVRSTAGNDDITIKEKQDAKMSISTKIISANPIQLEEIKQIPADMTPDTVSIPERAENDHCLNQKHKQKAENTALSASKVANEKSMPTQDKCTGKPPYQKTTDFVQTREIVSITRQDPDLSEYAVTPREVNSRSSSQTKADKLQQTTVNADKETIPADADKPSESVYMLQKSYTIQELTNFSRSQFNLQLDPVQSSVTRHSASMPHNLYRSSIAEEHKEQWPKDSMNAKTTDMTKSRHKPKSSQPPRDALIKYKLKGHDTWKRCKIMRSQPSWNYNENQSNPVNVIMKENQWRNETVINWNNVATWKQLDPPPTEEIKTEATSTIPPPEDEPTETATEPTSLQLALAKIEGFKIQSTPLKETKNTTGGGEMKKRESASTNFEKITPTTPSSMRHLITDAINNENREEIKIDEEVTPASVDETLVKSGDNTLPEVTNKIRKQKRENEKRRQFVPSKKRLIKDNINCQQLPTKEYTWDSGVSPAHTVEQLTTTPLTKGGTNADKESRNEPEISTLGNPMMTPNQIWTEHSTHRTNSSSCFADDSYFEELHTTLQGTPEETFYTPRFSPVTRRWPQLTSSILSSPTPSPVIHASKLNTPYMTAKAPAAKPDHHSTDSRKINAGKKVQHPRTKKLKIIGQAKALHYKFITKRIRNLQKELRKHKKIIISQETKINYLLTVFQDPISSQSSTIGSHIVTAKKKQPDTTIRTNMMAEKVINKDEEPNKEKESTKAETRDEGKNDSAPKKKTVKSAKGKTQKGIAVKMNQLDTTIRTNTEEEKEINEGTDQNKENVNKTPELVETVTVADDKNQEGAPVKMKQLDTTKRTNTVEEKVVHKEKENTAKTMTLPQTKNKQQITPLKQHPIYLNV